MRLSKIEFFSFISLDPDNYRFEDHRHNTYEANIVLDGDMEVTVEENAYHLTSGNVLIWGPNCYHYNKLGSDNHVEFATVHFLADEDFLEADQPIFCHFDTEKMVLFNLFVGEAKSHGTEANSPAIPLLEAIIKMILCRSDTPHFFNNNSAKIYGKVIRMMALHSVRTIPKIPELARRCGVSETTLKNAFKQHSGKSVKKYYNDMRIQYAKDMLLSGMSANKVAETLGFSSLSYFSQFFKRNAGLSVRDYVAQFKE